MKLLDNIKKLAAEKFEYVKDIRRHIHQHPELSFKEFETSAFVSSKLDESGILHSNIAGTGILATIEGQNPDSATVFLRSDLDALPITEKNDVPYISLNEGIMHACGHDVHTSSLLGAASILKELNSQFQGSIKLIFQPGEELLPGGASLIIKEGIIKGNNIKGILGQHVMPELPVGKAGFRAGKYMASTDEIYITVKGKGGHGAMPDMNKDPVLMVSHLIVALQQVVSRWAKPSMPTVLSFGKIIGNGATNIIPDEVKLEGTFRTFDEKWRMEAHSRIIDFANSFIKSMGGEAEIKIEKGYPFLKNDESLTNKMIIAAEHFLGKENVEELELRTTAEDFAFYTHYIPGCFYRLGTGNVEKGIVSHVHSSTFDIDENALITGAGMMAWLGMELING
jgi:amidohydrolase